MPTLTAQSLTLAHHRGSPVVHDLDLALAPGTITTLVGPNGSGKSTLLKGLVRLLPPARGAVVLDGADIHRLPTREVARKLGLLAQHADAPGGLTVLDLVRRGRYPHRGAFEPLGPEDHRAVQAALERCGVADWQERLVDELSGGQRQRVWIALTLAQETPLLLLDEPTTFLDPQHQIELLELIRSLQSVEGKTLVLVLHDLGQAAQVSQRVVALQDGRVVSDGAPEAVFTAERLRGLYGVEFDLVRDASGGLRPLPRSRLDLSRPRPSFPDLPTLSARGLVGGYGGRAVVGPVDLSFGPGGFEVLLGPNGSGKSTLLRTMAGLQASLGGRVEVHGRDAGPLSGRAWAKLRAFLSQEAAAPAGLTVRELIDLGRFPHRGAWGRRSTRDQDAVARALAALELESWADHSVDQLSGGQRQRVWLALALVQDSPLILLDEPTSFLDPGHQIELLDALWSLTRAGPRLVVAILHDPELAARYADRVTTLSSG